MPEDARERNAVDVAVIVAKSLWLATKMLFALMRFKRKANRAARNFRKAALKGGMSKAQANQLCEEYVGYASIRKLIKSVTKNGKIPFLS